MTGSRLPLVALVLSSAGCATLQPVRDPAAFISQTNPQVVFATHKNGAVLAVAQPRLRGDTLLGMRQGLSLPVALPLSQVHSIQAIQRDKKRTTVLIAGAAALTATLGYLLVQARGGSGPSCDYSGVTGEPLAACDGP
jgi:hypothetical protein